MDIKKTYITVFISVILISLLAYPIFYEPDIHNATHKDLTEIYGIGDLKANLILSYLETNKTCEIGDLVDIKGIGITLVERIDKAYR